jgi:hypothetical protein
MSFYQVSTNEDLNVKKYEKQDQQGKAAFNERNPPYDPATRTNGKEPRRTPDIKRTGQRHVNH